VPEESTTPDLAVLARRLGEAWNARDVNAIMSFYALDAIFDLGSWGLVAVGSYVGHRERARCRNRARAPFDS
jgi:hypothetical protein